MNPKTTKIYCWNKNSEGAAALATALGVKRIKHERSSFEWGSKYTVINWGSSALPEKYTASNDSSKILNNPKAISVASNKLSFYKTLEGKLNPDVLVPWTEDKDKAISWLDRSEDYVVARTILNGSGGDGIVMMHKDKPDSFVKAGLYTKYVPKSDEYRVHVMGKKIFLIQRKGLRKVLEDGTAVDPKAVDWKIRNLSSGFVFVRNNVECPKVVTDAALNIFDHLGLDFYAADVIYNKHSDRAYVLEVNTAPGLNGTTIEDYKNAFEEYAQ